MVSQRIKSPRVAVILSLIWPGLGLVYCGRIFIGIFIMVIVMPIVGYLLTEAMAALPLFSMGAYEAMVTYQAPPISLAPQVVYPLIIATAFLIAQAYYTYRVAKNITQKEPSQADSR